MTRLEVFLLVLCAALATIALMQHLVLSVYAKAVREAHREIEVLLARGVSTRNRFLDQSHEAGR